MKIVSFNVNGLRPRAKEFGGLKQLLDALDADIICLQETKLARTDLSADVAVADGYESFFAFPRGKHARGGWSGVATFCRTGGGTSGTSAVLPTAAEEGFTGVQHLRAGGALAEGVVGQYEAVWAGETGSRARLEELDQEGRTVVTDHGAFVLFNIYGPCVQPGDDERIAFKLDFYRTLQRRWESLLAAGRRLVVVGDLNIAPAAVDSVHAGPDVNASPSRVWLQSMLRANGGPFTDTFRTVHPDRRDAYTCFSTASGAAAFNYGSRIDLILVAGLCQHAAQRRPAQGQGGKQAVDWGGHGTGEVGIAEADEYRRDCVGSTSGQREAFEGALQHMVDTDASLAGSFDVREGSRGVAGAGGLSGSLQAHLFEEFREAVRRHSTGANEAAAADGLARFRADTAGCSPQSTVQCTEEVNETQKEQRQTEGSVRVAGQGQDSLKDDLPAASVDKPVGRPEVACWPCSAKDGAHGLAECEVVGADICSVFPGSSDHRPVFVCLRPQPEGPSHRVPPLSTRFMPELRGKQTRILGYLGSRPTVGPAAAVVAAPLPPAPGDASTSSGPAVDGAAAARRADAGLGNGHSGRTTGGLAGWASSRGPELGKKRKGAADGGRPAKQRSLRELFGAAVAPKLSGAVERSSSLRATVTALAAPVSVSKEREDDIEDTSSADVEGSSRGAWSEPRAGGDAAAGWAALRARMAARHPVCRHGEPAVARVVKKAGPTVGRTFFCCARATGPSSNPEARCDYFEWALSNTARSLKPSSGRTR